MNVISRPLSISRGLSQGHIALAVVVILTVARFAVAPVVPLAYDEAYYWRWSIYPELGYFDHPPLIAWMIDLGTSIAGNNEFGVRLVPLVLSVPTSWAVWRSAVILFGDTRLAMSALVFFNVMLILAVGTVIATPDAPLLFASAIILLFLAKIVETGRPFWWIAIGVAAGIGCLAKFTALFWLPSIFLWLIFSPRMRPWLRTPWPWAGATVAFLIFFPNLVWNATHDWATFGKQFGRVAADGFAPEYLIEHLGTEIGMATPIVFVLGWLGLWAFLVGRGGGQSARVLLLALVLPMSIYFIYHATHSRVEGNWTGPIFPAFALAAAAAIHSIEWQGSIKRIVEFARMSAVPVGLIFVVIIYSQALLGWLPHASWDPTASKIGVGMEAVAEEVETIRRSQDASLIVTASYPMTSWLSFYGAERPALVYQYNERERWVQEPATDPEMFEGPLLAVLPEGDPVDSIEAEFGPAEELTTLVRRRGGSIVAR
ncbi:MAG: glycosyltransferase family 39 protein, partial [Alphaproteobacteria bacterium]